MAGFFKPDELIKARQPLPTVARCGACGLLKTCQSPKMPVAGEGRRGILIVGEAPGKDEDAQGKPFVGASGRFLQDRLSRLGVKLFRDCWVTNALICRPPGNKIEDPRAVEYCRPNLIRSVQELRPTVVIVLGGTAVESLLGWLWKPDAGGISRWVGWRIPDQKINAWVCPNYHPSFVLREDAGKQAGLLREFFDHYLEAAVAQTDSRPWATPPRYADRVRVELDVSEAARVVRRITRAGRPAAFDFETTTLKPDSEKSRVVSCAIADSKGAIAFPWHDEAREAAREFLHSTCPKVGWNCFSGDARFLTKEYGVVRFVDVLGKNVTVLNHEGRWVDGRVNSFGRQPTVSVTFCRRNFKNTVRTTLKHEWISAENGRRITTENLRTRRYGGKTGADSVPFLCAPKIIESMEEYVQGIRHGIVLGDGSKRTERKNTFYVRLCGRKNELLPYFDGYTRSYPPSYEGDPIVYLTEQHVDLKQPPPEWVSDSYLIGFARGLLATDGYVSQSSGQVSITNRKSVLRWCARYLPRVGYLFQGRHSNRKYLGKYSGGYENSKVAWTLFFSRESVTPEDLLMSKHRANWKRVNLGPYKFSGAEDLQEEHVYCVTVPDGNSFTLEGGLVTGNCKFEDRWTRKEFGRPVRNWVWDGMLAAHVLDCREGITGLKFQAYAMLGEASYDDHIKPYLMSSGGGNALNRVAELDLSNLLRYNGADAVLEYEIGVRQAEQLGISLEG